MFLDLWQLKWIIFACFPGLFLALKDEDWNAPTREDPYKIAPEPNHLSTDKPNIIMFMPDQLRFDAVGTFGNPVSPCS